MRVWLTIAVLITGCLGPTHPDTNDEHPEATPYPDDPLAKTAWQWQLPEPGNAEYCARCTATNESKLPRGYYQYDDAPEMCIYGELFRDDGGPPIYGYQCIDWMEDFARVHSARTWTLSLADLLLLDASYQRYDGLPAWAGPHATEPVPGDVNAYPEGDFPTRLMAGGRDYGAPSVARAMPAGGFDKVRIDVGRYDGAPSNLTEVHVQVDVDLEMFVGGVWVKNATLPVDSTLQATHPFLVRWASDDPESWGRVLVRDLPSRLSKEEIHAIGYGAEAIYRM